MGWQQVTFAVWIWDSLPRGMGRFLASVNFTISVPFLLLLNLREDSEGTYLRARMMSPRLFMVHSSSGGSVRSWRLNHLAEGSSKTCPAMGIITSPRKSFLPNMSLCHTDIHMVRLSTSFRGITNLSISSNIGLSVCFFTLVFLFPALLRSGNRYTFTYGSDLFLLVSTAAKSRHCLMLMSRLPLTML